MRKKSVEISSRVGGNAAQDSTILDKENKLPQVYNVKNHLRRVSFYLFFIRISYLDAGRLGNDVFVAIRKTFGITASI